MPDTSLYEEQHTVTWTIDRGTPLTFTTGPHSGTTTAAITDASHSIAAFDKISIQVQTRARQRTYDANTLTYSLWTAWGPWSAQAGPAHDLDADGDELGNGIQDDIVGCPIPSTPPINNPQCPDPSHIPATYPPGHAQAGQPTGHCFPTGSPCLPPPDGTGAADVVCMPRGS